MTDIVRDAIAEMIEDLEPTLPTPEEPFGYGTDLSCRDDLTATMESVDPFSVEAIAESLARLYQTPKNTVPGAPGWGEDLRQYLNRGTTTHDIRAIAERARVAGEADDRIRSIAVKVTPSADGSTLAIAIRVRPRDIRLGPFTATLAVTSAAVILEEIRS